MSVLPQDELAAFRSIPALCLNSGSDSLCSARDFHNNKVRTGRPTAVRYWCVCGTTEEVVDFIQPPRPLLREALRTHLRRPGRKNSWSRSPRGVNYKSGGVLLRFRSPRLRCFSCLSS